MPVSGKQITQESKWRLPLAPTPPPTQPRSLTQLVPVVVRGLVLPVLVALRPIAAGEQLLRDYGAAWWQGIAPAWEVAEDLGLGHEQVLWGAAGAAARIAGGAAAAAPEQRVGAALTKVTPGAAADVSMACDADAAEPGEAAGPHVQEPAVDGVEWQQAATDGAQGAVTPPLPYSVPAGACQYPTWRRLVLPPPPPMVGLPAGASGAPMEQQRGQAPGQQLQVL